MTAFIDFSSLTALVVDDKKPIHRLMETILYRLGFRRVLSVYDGFEAKQTLRAEGKSIDIVFCDLQMPHVDGIAFIKNIRRSPFKHLPVVVITAHGDRDILIEALNIGIEGFLAKPIAPEQVAAHLPPALRKRRIDPTVVRVNERITDYLQDGRFDTEVRPIVWSADLRVGNQHIDAEHKDLIETINSFVDAFKGGAKKETIASIYQRLLRETDVHFGHEEELMRRTGYPEFKAHKREHDDFVKRIGVLYQRYEKDQPGSVSELTHLLPSWWVAHVTDTDRKLAAYLRTKSV